MSKSTKRNEMWLHIKNVQKCKTIKRHGGYLYKNTNYISPNLSGEKWKEIPLLNYPCYCASNLGRIKSLSHFIYKFRNQTKYKQKMKGRILHQYMNDDGYLQVTLSSRNHEHKRISVHRLVALTFIPNPHHYPAINHIKEFEKFNNKVSNLEWCSNKYNENYGTCHERAIQQQMQPLLLYNDKLKKKFKSHMSCARYMQDNLVSTKATTLVKEISDVKRGKQKTIHGFHIKFY